MTKFTCSHCKKESASIVHDSRFVQSKLAIRRRRECKECRKRYTTYEAISSSEPIATVCDHPLRSLHFKRNRAQAFCVKCKSFVHTAIQS